MTNPKIDIAEERMPRPAPRRRRQAVWIPPETSLINAYRILSGHPLFALKDGLLDRLVRALYRRFGRRVRGGKLYYNLLADPFNKVFFWKNLFKCILFFGTHPELTEYGICDIGCGAGPASIAVTQIRRDAGLVDVSLRLVDHSSQQLSLARDLMHMMGAQVVCLTRDFSRWKMKRTKGLAVFSYSFCEQQDGFLKVLFMNRRQFSEGFAVIDYEENLQKIAEYFRVRGEDEVYSESITVELDESLAEIIGNKEVTVHACYYRP